MEISKNTLEKIKNENIKPRPRWQFIMWHILLWSGLMLSIIFGSISVSLMIRELSIAEWDIGPRIAGDIFRPLVIFLPYIWIFCLLLTLFSSYQAFRHTPKGYRHQPHFIVAAVVLVSLVIGSSFHLSGLSDLFEQKAREHIHPYNELEKSRESFFASPERGILAGKVVKITSHARILFEDVSGKRWTLIIGQNHQKPILLKPGLPILVIGQQEREGIFVVEQIRPWKRHVFFMKLKILNSTEQTLTTYYVTKFNLNISFI